MLKIEQPLPIDYLKKKFNKIQQNSTKKQIAPKENRGNCGISGYWKKWAKLGFMAKKKKQVKTSQNQSKNKLLLRRREVIDCYLENGVYGKKRSLKNNQKRPI